jgi:hypothetical protein
MLKSYSMRFEGGISSNAAFQRCPVWLGPPEPWANWEIMRGLL